MFLLRPLTKDPVIFASTFILIFISLFVLNSFSSELFPQYYIYIGVSIIAFYIFYFIGFGVVKYFSVHLYIIGVLLLLLTLVIGQVTRGSVRWIPIGNFAFQASEIVRPFLLLFYAKIISEYKGGFKRMLLIITIAIVPVVLIAIQPSFGVSIITLLGLLTIFAVKFVKGKNIIALLLVFLLVIPTVWFALKPYQKERISTFVNYEKDPKGAGYNTIQSIISVGSGGFLGKGFKKGFQTQLKYLPEKHTDFIFAGISEEMGFLGSFTVLLLLYVVFYRAFHNALKGRDEVYRLFTTGIIVVFLIETIINVGMNLGILPITGLPLPFISAGGSSLLASLISISLIISGI